MKHTPGPWTVTDKITGDSLPHRWIADCGDYQSIVTQGVGNNASHAAALANARLIAAAPELVAALEEVRVFARLSCPHGVDRDLWQSTFDRVESILTKLKG